MLIYLLCCVQLLNATNTSLDIIIYLLSLVQLLDATNTSLDIIEATEAPEGELLDIVLRNPLVEGQNYTLTIHYRGYFRDDSLGLYAFGYVDPEEKVRYVAHLLKR